MRSSDRSLEEATNLGIASAAYSITACVIFCCVSLCFFFPVNGVIPLDRRSCAIIGATACYLSRIILFPSNQIDTVDAIDFDVLVLLTGIMTVNFVVVHQKETKRVISWVQKLIQEKPRKGFWVTSVIVLLTSPFLTNDGVCLLFVEPILDTFIARNSESDRLPTSDAPGSIFLERSDAFYFLIALSCSSNIGSAMTYTGNPQVKCIL